MQYCRAVNAVINAKCYSLAFLSHAGAAFTILMLLASLNSCTNPWIYTAFSNSVSRELLALLRCYTGSPRRGSLPDDSTTTHTSTNTKDSIYWALAWLYCTHTHKHTANTPQTRRARPCPKCHSLPTCWWHSAAGLLKTFLEFKMTNGMPYGLHGQVPMAQMCKKCAVWYGTGVMSCLATLDSGTWRLHNLKSRYWSVIDSVTSITKTKLHCHAQCILQTAVHSVTWKQTGVMNQEEG